jgi:hypothetical protein
MDNTYVKELYLPAKWNTKIVEEARFGGPRIRNNFSPSMEIGPVWGTTKMDAKTK